MNQINPALNKRYGYFDGLFKFLTARHYFRIYLCAMVKILEELVLFYLVYKIIFDLIVPAAQTSKQVKKQFTDMQNKIQEQAEKFNSQQNTQYNSSNNSTAYSKPDKDDYIEFEE